MFKKHLNWETAQYLVLFLTVAGQVLIGVNYYWGQGAWLIANAITVTRNVKLERPKAGLCLPSHAVLLLRTSLLDVR